MTHGQNAKHYLAGALHLTTGKVLYCLGPRKNNELFRDLLTLLESTPSASSDAHLCRRGSLLYS